MWLIVVQWCTSDWIADQIIDYPPLKGETSEEFGITTIVFKQKCINNLISWQYSFIQESICFVSSLGCLICSRNQSLGYWRDCSHRLYLDVNQSDIGVDLELEWEC